VLLDTDIGSDVDDAFALAYLLAQKRCRLLGITTVTGDPEKRAALASVLCTVAGRDIPIHAGSPLPLLVDQKQMLAPQAESLARWPHQASYPASSAVEFLRQAIRAHPGQVTLLCIGPLTNIGLLFSVDPEIPSLLKALVLMCGSFTRDAQKARAVEWNARVDPHAAAIVYRARPPVHRSIGLDVTLRVEMPADEVRALLDRPLLRPVLDFAEIWFRKSPTIVFHDPLAAVTLFEPEVCAFERGNASIVLGQPATAGMTLWTPSGQGAHEIAVKVQPAAFFKAYFEVFGA
jgi:inosine-uridine nucleoside N-ribohydrolase